MELDCSKEGIVDAAHDQRCIRKLVVRRNRSGRFAGDGKLAEIHPAIVQKRRADPSQAHQRRCAKLAAVLRGQSPEQSLHGHGSNERIGYDCNRRL